MTIETSNSAVRRDTAGHGGEVLGAWEIMPGHLLLLGWQAGAVAEMGNAAGEPAHGKGDFSSLSWRLASNAIREMVPSHGYIVHVRLPASPGLSPGQTITLWEGKSTVGHQPLIARLPAELHNPQAFITEASRVSKSSAYRMGQFLAEVLSNAAMAGVQGVPAALAKFLVGASVSDGCIELIANVEGKCGVLQGWGQTGKDPVEIIAVGSSLARFQAQSAVFSRTDISLPSSGVVIVVPREACHCLHHLSEIYILSGEHIRRRPVVEGAQHFSPDESVAHIRELVPTLKGDRICIEQLRAATRPRYQGYDSINALPFPVRASVDIAVHVGDTAYLHGWVLDPTGLIETASVRNPLGSSTRIDHCWTRISRPDVTDGFRHLPGFPTAGSARSEHGFAVTASGLGSPTNGLYLELVLRNGHVAFMPIQESDPVSAATDDLLLGSVDMYKSSGMHIIEHQLAPFYRSATRISPIAPPVTVFGADPATGTAIVVQLPQEPELPRAFLSQFLRDPLSVEEGIIFVCGDEWQSGDVATLRKELAFRGLDAMLIRLNGRTTAPQALSAAAQVTKARHLLSLGWRTHGCEPGWRGRLTQALDGRDPESTVSATQIYEDYSIRFAGIRATTGLQSSPWFSVDYCLGGLPAALAGTGRDVLVLAGSLAACLLPRALLIGLPHAEGSFCTEEAEELDFFLRLGREGCLNYWSPGAKVFALDQERGSSQRGQVSRLIDGWCLRDAWAPDSNKHVAM